MSAKMMRQRSSPVIYVELLGQVASRTSRLKDVPLIFVVINETMERNAKHEDLLVCDVFYVYCGF